MSYYFGGTLHEDDPTYVKRKADDELFEGLKTGQFCYVLSSRQTGKSSLRVRTMSSLKQKGFVCSIIDVSADATYEIKPSQWYANLVSTLTYEFDLDFDVGSWYRQQDWFSPLSRFREFIESVLLAQIQEKIVIFIDEIDSLLSLPFPTDDFFALIRACHNKRVDKPIYNRLTFCLLGVATPSDLIRDKKRTPFNIGKGIELTRFTFEEARDSLTPGLAKKVNYPEKVLSEVLNWTGGQPFLTQKLCQLVIDKAKSSQPDIKQLVQTYVIDNWENQDIPEHMGTIRDRLLADEKIAGLMLGLYEDILRNGSISADMSEEKMQLRLSGLVAKEHEKLVVYNPIYEKIFEHNWISKKLAELRPDEYALAFNAWISSGRDDSLLLRDKDLEVALRWKEGRNLSAEDQDFIVRSQELDRQQKQKANQILERASRTAQEITRIERAGASALRQFELQETEALITALKAVQSLEALKISNNLKEYPTTTPLLALQTILNRIRELRLERESSRVSYLKVSPQKDFIAIGYTDGTVSFFNWKGIEIFNFKAHQSEIFDLAFSPDGHLIATRGIGEKEINVKLWALDKNRVEEQIATLRAGGSSWQGSSVVFSPDGSSIATIADGDDYTDNTIVNLWDIKGNLVRCFQTNQAIGTLVVFNFNGKRLATYSVREYKWKIWNLEGQRIIEFENAISPSPCFLSEPDEIFSPKDNLIAIANQNNGSVTLLDLDGNIIRTIQAHSELILKLRFSPNGQHFTTVGYEKHSNNSLPNSVLKVWDLQGNQVANFFLAHDVIRGVRFHPSGNQVAIWSEDNKIQVFDLERNTENKLFSDLQGSNPSSHTLDLQFSRNDTQIITLDERYYSVRSATIWNLRGNPLTILQGGGGVFPLLEFTPDGNRILTRLGFWDLQGNLIGRLEWGPYNHSFHPKYDLFATVRADGKVVLRDFQCVEILTYEAGGASAIAFAPQGSLLAIGREDGLVILWDLEKNEIDSLRTLDKTVESITFSPDGNLIAIGRKEGAVTLWNFQKKQYRHLKPEQSSSSHLAFSPNGKCIVIHYSSHNNSRTELWELQYDQDLTLRLDRKLHFPEHIAVEFSSLDDNFVIHSKGIVTFWGSEYNQVSSLEIQPTIMKFSPVDNVIVIGDEDGVIRILDSNGNSITSFQASTSGFNDISKVIFSPDGNQFAVSNVTKNEIKIWNMNGQQTAEYEGFNMAIAPNWSKIVTVSARDRYNPMLWPIYKHEELVEQGYNRIHNYLLGHREHFEELKPCRKLFLVKQGEKLAREGKITEAISMYSEAQRLDSTWLISVNSWKILCGYGSRYGHFSEVKYACDKAMEGDLNYTPRVSIGVQINVDSAERVVVKDIFSNSPAQKAGLQANDIILQVDGQSVSTVEEVIKIITNHQVGDVISIEFQRQVKKQKVEVQTTEMWPIR